MHAHGALLERVWEIESARVILRIANMWVSGKKAVL